MQYLLELVKLGAATTLLDVDNALYMTAAIEPLPPEKQKKAIFWGLLLLYIKSGSQDRRRLHK